MGTTMAAIAVDGGTDTEAVLAALLQVAHRLDEQGELADEMLAIAPPAADGDPVRWLTLGWSSREYGISGSFVLDVLGESLPAITWIVHDDRHGEYSFVHQVAGRRVLALRSDGPYVDVVAGEITVDHPQRAFTREDLEALHRKPEEELTDAEARAIMEYDNAVTIGLRQVHPGAGRGYLQLPYSDAAWWLARGGRVLDVPEPAPRRAADTLPGWLVPRQLDALAVGAPPRTGGDWFHVALERRDAGDDAGAFEALLRATGADPDLVPAYIQLIWLAAWRLDRPEAALASLATLRARGVSYEGMDSAEARALFLLGRHSEAVAALDRHLAAHPDDDIGHYNRACYAGLAHGAATDERERQQWRAVVLAALARAVELAPEHGPDAGADPDLASLHDDPEVQRLTRSPDTT